MNTRATVVVVTLALACAAAACAHAHFDLADPSIWSGLDAPAAIAAMPARDRQVARAHAEYHKLYVERSPALAAAAAKSHMTCGECQFVVGLVEWMTKHETVANSSLPLVYGICNAQKNKTAAQKKACRDTAKLVVLDLLPMLWRGMLSLAWNIPLNVCADIVKVCTINCCGTPTAPEQVHINFANSTDWVGSMRATWATLLATPGAGVKWRALGAGRPSFAPEETRTVAPFKQGGWVGVIHSAVMTNLKSSTAYQYQVGSDASGWSQSFSFTTLPRSIGNAARPLRVLGIADMGYGDASNDTVAQITRLVRGELGASMVPDFIAHPGDISYSDGNEQGWRWFNDKIQPFAARVPNLTTPGNHELYWNISAYKNFYGMSTPRAGHGVPDDAMYYHQVVGSANFFLMDSETWFDTPHIGQRQVQWFKDVAAAHPTPVKIALHHRPLYCTGTPKLQCGLFAKILRLQAEALYAEQRVDLVVAGHMHEMERSWPLLEGRVARRNYTRPGAPVHYVNGAAGNREGNSRPHLDKPWAAAGTRDVGFAMHVITDTSIETTFYRSSDMKVIDTFTIVK